MIDVELIDDLNRFADLSERISEWLHAHGGRIDRAGEFQRAYTLHQHADVLRDAGVIARYQARELGRV